MLERLAKHHRYLEYKLGKWWQTVPASWFNGRIDKGKSSRAFATVYEHKE